MPPRHAYWTILIDGSPTAFRAREREELLPTLNQLGRTNTDVVLRYFARGKLWDSPEQAQWAGKNPRPLGEERGREWRPGGTHADPRARFDKKSPRAPRSGPRTGDRGPAATDGRTTAPPPDQKSADRPASRSTEPRSSRPAPKDGERRPWTPKAPGGAKRPWTPRPDGDQRKPWEGRKDGGSTSRPPVGDRPLPGDARNERRPETERGASASGKPPWRDKPWTPKPPGGSKRPWTPRPDGDQRKPWEARKDGGSSSRPPVGDRPLPGAARNERRPDAERGASASGKPPWRDKPWTPKPPGGPKRPWTPRPDGDQRKPWEARKDGGSNSRPPVGDRPLPGGARNERRPETERGASASGKPPWRDKPWTPKPPGGPKRPWTPRPDGDQRKPWEARKDGGSSSRPPVGDRPLPGGARNERRPDGERGASASGKPPWRDKPWTPKPPGGPKRPWTPRPDGDQRKPWEARKDGGDRKPKSRG